MSLCQIITETKVAYALVNDVNVSSGDEGSLGVGIFANFMKYSLYVENTHKNKVRLQRLMFSHDVASVLVQL